MSPHFSFLLRRDITNCEVVTAWAGGCTWTQAVELSGLPPGDLARTLSRVLDAVRQLGNLPFTALRKKDFEDTVEIATVSRGLDPAVRRLCRDASLAINRYPVKDPFAFETSSEEEKGDADIADDNQENSQEDSSTDIESASTEIAS